MTTSALLSTYDNYLTALHDLPYSNRVIPYNWTSLPETLPSKWLAYSLMISEFSRELANIINTFTDYVRRLRAWSTVVETLSLDDKVRVTHELIDPLAIVAVGLPYAIRSRFIFATAHLCHQANQTKLGEEWVDDLALDRDIYFAEAQSTGSNWRKFRRLKLCIERIGGSAFRASTHDFRNAYNHRFSPNFVVGITQIIRRSVDGRSNRIHYIFGGVQALDLGEVSIVLLTQRDHCYATFDAFRSLVEEHELCIMKTL